VISHLLTESSGSVDIGVTCLCNYYTPRPSYYTLLVSRYYSPSLNLR